jgi:hypothetical protein
VTRTWTSRFIVSLFIVLVCESRGLEGVRDVARQVAPRWHFVMWHFVMWQDRWRHAGIL